VGLRSLELQENLLTRIGRNTLAACKQLTELNLSSNSIIYDGQVGADGRRQNRFLAAQAFEALEKLDLSYNSISVLDESLKLTFLNLARLDLSHNSFTNFVSDDFKFVKVEQLLPSSPDSFQYSQKYVHYFLQLRIFICPQFCRRTELHVI
jgi:Leucine-rich repeat (LRR) protein